MTTQRKSFKQIKKLSKTIEKENDKFKIRFTKCYLCGEFLNIYTSNIDHIIPKKELGLNVKENMVYVHTKCNQDKNCQVFHEKLLVLNIVAFFKLDLKNKTMNRSIIDSLISHLLMDVLFNINTKNTLRNECYNVLNNNISITLNDFYHILAILELYGIEFENINSLLKYPYQGYIPKERYMYKFKQDYILTNKAMNVITNFITLKLLNLK